ncbi:MAG TPA: BON domain-containing protein [Longimicrobiales bacterium]
MPDDYEDLYDLDNLDADEIYDLLVQELGDYPDLDPDLLEIEVEDGFVTLTGRVGTEQELQEIEYVLTDVLGISNYSNELIVDELVRAEAAVGADDAVVEDEEVEAQFGEEGERTDPQADHLLVDLGGEQYGTHNAQRAIARGEAYEPPDHPLQEGSWSEERH